MNIPFGVKGLTLADDCCERIKEIIKVGTKSEPLFMTLTCQLLDEGGKAAVIVPDGVLVNCSKQHDTFRQYLLDNFKVLRIIKMRGKFFMNTGIQPSVIVFERSGKTDTVEFWDVEKKDSGELVETCMLKVAREKFDGSYSFDMRRYQEAKFVANLAGFPMVKLSDICNDISTSKNIPSSERNDGEFKFFTCSRDYSTHSVSHYDGSYLIHGSRGSTISESIFVTDNEKFAIGTSMFVSEVKDKNKVNTKYLYYYLKFNKEVVDNLVNSSAIPMISKTSYYTIEVPLPPLPIQQEIVESLDLIYNNANTAKLAASSIKDQMAAVMRSVGARGSKKKKLGDMCSFVNGHAFKSEEFIHSGIPVVKITTIKDNVITLEKVCYVRENNKLNGFIVKNGDFVVALSGATVGIIGINTTGTECYLNQRVARIDVISSLTSTRYIYLTMVYGGYIGMIRELAGGSAQPNVSTKNIEELDIPIPPLPIQEEVLTILNEMEADLKVMEQMAAKAEQRAKYILDGYLSTQTTVQPEPVQEIAVDPQPTNEVVPTSQESPKPKKKVFKVKKCVEPSE
jgi:type I restriction enzyme S subunit